MVKVFIMYKLKPQIDMKDYYEFSINLDKKVTGKQPGVYKFEAYKILGAEDGVITYQIVEVLEVESVEAFKKVLVSKEIEEVEKRYKELVDLSTERILYGEIIKWNVYKQIMLKIDLSTCRVNTHGLCLWVFTLQKFK